MGALLSYFATAIQYEMGGLHMTSMHPACPQPTHSQHIDPHNPPVQLIWGRSSSKNMKIHIYSAAGPNPYMLTN